MTVQRPALADVCRVLISGFDDDPHPMLLPPWLHPSPADALGALVEAELLPEHWADEGRAPRWWCERCRGGEKSREALARGVGVICGDCFNDNLAPPSHAALCAVASLGVDTLARAEAIVAETWPGARLVWRVMGAAALRKHHDRASGDVPPPGASILPLMFSVETLTATDVMYRRNSGKSWEERCPYGGDASRGGFGTPDDDRHGVHRAWPALRALAALGLHLVALDDARVVLAVESIT